MSINDLADEMEGLVVQAAMQAKAIEPCRFHPYVVIYRGDNDADRHAYALATNMWKEHGRVFERDEVMDAVKAVFVLAADGGCPQCRHQLDAD